MALPIRFPALRPAGATCRALPLLLTAALTVALPARAAGVQAQGGNAAAGDARLLILPYASIHGMLPSQIGEKSAQFLEAELKGAAGVQLVHLARAADAEVNPTPAEDQALLQRAQQSAAEARAALDSGDFPLAIAKFHQAIELERSQHPYIDFPELVGQYVGLAVASFQLGEEDEGSRYLEEAARLDPAHELDAAALPPIFIRAFESLVQKIGAQPRAALSLASSIEGSRVFLDGREIGATPLRRSDLLPGPHFLRVVPPRGATIWAQPIELVSGQTLAIAARIDLVGGALAEIERDLSQNQLSREVAVHATELARQAGATHVVLGGVHQEKGGIAVSSFLLSMRDQTVCPIDKALFDAGMLSAGIEIYKVGVDLLAQLSTCKAPRKLPTPVAPDAPTRTAQAAFAEPEALSAFLNHAHVPAAKDPAAPAAPEVMAGAPRSADLQPPLTAASAVAAAPPEGSAPLAQQAGRPAVAGESRNLTWLWITLGIVAAAGLATGGYFIYDAAQNPAGQGTVSWTP